MSKRKKILSSLNTASIGVILLIIIWFSWLGFSSRQIQNKNAEVRVILNKIFDAEVAYYRDPANEKKFLPLSSQPLEPTRKPQIGNFSDGEWSPLHLSISTPVYYSYSVEILSAGLGASFKVIARGDLDSDQEFSRFEMIGQVDSKGNVQGKDVIYALDPWE